MHAVLTLYGFGTTLELLFLVVDQPWKFSTTQVYCEWKYRFRGIIL